MNAQWNAPISDRFSSLCARVFSPVAAILKCERTLGTRLLPAFLCAHIFIKRETSGYEADSWKSCFLLKTATFARKDVRRSGLNDPRICVTVWFANDAVHTMQRGCTNRYIFPISEMFLTWNLRRREILDFVSRGEWRFSPFITSSTTLIFKT